MTPKGHSSTGLWVRDSARIPESGSLHKATEQKVEKTGVRVEDSGGLRDKPDSLQPGCGNGPRASESSSLSNRTPDNKGELEAF